jgi:hypothetical protein
VPRLGTAAWLTPQNSLPLGSCMTHQCPAGPSSTSRMRVAPNFSSRVTSSSRPQAHCGHRCASGSSRTSARGHTERIGHFVGCRPGQGRRTKNRPGNLRSVGKAGSFGGSRAGQRDSDSPSAPCLRQIRMLLGPRSATDPVAETGAAAPAPLDGRASRAGYYGGRGVSTLERERDAAERVLGWTV